MKKVIFISSIFPEPSSTAAGVRILQLIDLFLNENYQVYFLSTSSLSENSFCFNSERIKSIKIELNNSSFDKTIAKISADIVIFDRFIIEEQFGWRVSEICPNAIKILDTEDLHFLRKAREKAFKENKELQKNDLISDIFKREIASILRCDLSLIISEFEFELLINDLKINPEILHYLPMFAEVQASEKSFNERKNFISIGNFLHEPNWQTVLHLKKIWSKIREKLPNAELHIYGSYPSQKALQLHNEKEKFLIKGRTENLEETFNNAKVLLAPIPFGAGIKGKLLDSMRLGLPNITTPIGAEAMHRNLDWNGFITTDDEDFIDKAFLLYTDENIWQQAQQNGFELTTNLYQKDFFANDFVSKIRKIEKHLEQHRNNNFLGQILQHHSLQSTKYMSRWIEEKNKSYKQK